jgi:hypothetical protein
MEQQQIEEPAAVVVVKEEPADTELCTEPSKTAAAVCKYTTNSHEVGFFSK